jgi:hypothetical protein
MKFSKLFNSALLISSLIFSATIAAEKIDCSRVVKFVAYCQGACVYDADGARAARLRVTNIDGNKCLVKVGDAADIKIKEGFVAKNFVIQSIGCSGFGCSSGIGDYYVIVYTKRYNSGWKKYKFPKVKYVGKPIELDVPPIKNIERFIFNFDPLRGSKGISTSTGWGYILRGLITFELEPIKK